jgi:hypothetical protein
MPVYTKKYLHQADWQSYVRSGQNLVQKTHLQHVNPACTIKLVKIPEQSNCQNKKTALEMSVLPSVVR